MIDAIEQREQTLIQVRELAQHTTQDPGKVDELERLLQLLRQYSIKTVEMIVLWRD